MGLAASQARYLALTARKSDLEFQSQTINTRRMQLAQKSAEAAKAYTEGMSNRAIRIAVYDNNTATDGVTTKEWQTLTFETLLKNGLYKIIGANGEDLVPNPYKTVSISAAQYNQLNETEKAAYKQNGTEYTKTIVDPDYKGMDIQSLLVSGQAQLVTSTFYNFLNSAEMNGKTFEEIMDAWESTGQYTGIDSIVDWRSDTTSMFKQSNYTEDDAAVSAQYEAATAEIQAQDKVLEAEIKRIETEHKAVETEMESVKKVIDKNIENSYKSFA